MLTPFGGDDDNEEDKASSILICKDMFTVGRSKTCDHLLQGKKMISGRHFVVRKITAAADGDGGGVWAELEDSSTNGTMLNRTNLVKRTKVPLRDGDEINVVFGKAAQGQKNFGFTFHLLSSSSMKKDGDDEEELEETQNLEDDSIFSSPEGKTAATSSSASKRAREDDDEDGAGPSKKSNNNVTAAVPDEPDDMEENMVCCICQDILHDCVSVQPCMHCFCGGCYSEWMKRSKECPQCRKAVLNVAKNHTVNNLVNAYLKMHPGKRRDAADLAALDAKNKIKDEGTKKGSSRPAGVGLFSHSNTSNDDDEEYDSIHGDDYSDYDDDDDDADFNSGRPQYSFRRAPPRVRCQQCTSNRPAATGGASMTTSAGSSSAPAATHAYGTRRSSSTSINDDLSNTDAPATSSSSSSSSSIPPPPEFQCPPHQLHVRCQCCENYVPDRRFEPISDAFPAHRRQLCSLCSRVFCHAYFGCRRCDLGCLASLKETRFPADVTSPRSRIVLNNEFETEVLTDYLAAKSITQAELFAKCVENLDNGRYSVPDEVLRPSWGVGGAGGGGASFSSSSFSSSPTFPGQVTFGGAMKSDVLVCQPCALKVMKELVYQFREKDVDPADLPPAIVARQNCWWGRNCRTAITRSAHAAKLNHICAQTRRS